MYINSSPVSVIYIYIYLHVLIPPRFLWYICINSSQVSVIYIYIYIYIHVLIPPRFLWCIYIYMYQFLPGFCYMYIYLHVLIPPRFLLYIYLHVLIPPRFLLYIHIYIFTCVNSSQVSKSQSIHLPSERFPLICRRPHGLGGFGHLCTILWHTILWEMSSHYVLISVSMGFPRLACYHTAVTTFAVLILRYYVYCLEMCFTICDVILIYISNNSGAIKSNPWETMQPLAECPQPLSLVKKMTSWQDKDVAACAAIGVHRNSLSSVWAIFAWRPKGGYL